MNGTLDDKWVHYNECRFFIFLYMFGVKSFELRKTWKIERRKIHYLPPFGLKQAYRRCII